MHHQSPAQPEASQQQNVPITVLLLRFCLTDIMEHCNECIDDLVTTLKGTQEYQNQTHQYMAKIIDLTQQNAERTAAVLNDASAFNND